MELHINELVFEVTRKCNMHCAHCLRGEAENLDMPHRVIEKAISQVASIDTVVFGGGEVSLVPEKLEELLEAFRASGTPVNGFYAVTNGKTVSDDFLVSMLHWYSFCGYEDECSGLALSCDEFHEHIPEKNKMLLRGFSFLREEDKKNDWKHDYLLNEGRAKNLTGYKKRELSANDFNELEVDDNGNCWLEMAYITCNGDVLSTCDASYDDQERFKLGNVFDTDWVEKMVAHYDATLCGDAEAV